MTAVMKTFVFVGDIARSLAITERLIGKLASCYDKLHFRYQALPGTGCSGKPAGWVTIARWRPR
jgi:hypothetical protein